MAGSGTGWTGVKGSTFFPDFIFPYAQRRPPGSETVGFARFLLAVRSSLVIFQRMPSTVLQHAFAAAGSLLPSPSHVAQSFGSRKAGMRSASACSVERLRINSFAGTVTSAHAKKAAGGAAL